MNWIEVADTAIKIGLGAFIAAVASVLTILITQKHDLQKRNEDRFYKNQDERKIAYINFSTQSHALLKKYDYQWCNPSEEDYAEYLSSFSKVQILAEDRVRTCATDTLNAVSVYIFFNKSNIGSGDPDIGQLHNNLHSKAKESIAFFQKLAQLDITSMCNEK